MLDKVGTWEHRTSENYQQMVDEIGHAVATLQLY